VWATLLVAFAFNLVPVGRMPALPDFLALVLVFWNVHQSRRIGIGVAFFFGLLMDVHSGAVLGQHALAYTLLSFFAITVHRRLLWFAVPAQALQILPLFLAAHAVSLLVRVIAGGMFPGWEVLLAPVFEALLWPIATLLLLAPQRRAPDPDQNRPL
jgi:rod shape-determining protein MreD